MEVEVRSGSGSEPWERKDGGRRALAHNSRELGGKSGNQSRNDFNKSNGKRLTSSKSIKIKEFVSGKAGRRRCRDREWTKGVFSLQRCSDHNQPVPGGMVGCQFTESRG